MVVDNSASNFFDLKVKKAKEFGFPDPILLNTEQLTSNSRVIYLAEIQAMHIPDGKGNTHHFSLKFSKFKKIKEGPFWGEVDIVNSDGFTISDKSSIEKLATYINVNQALLKIDILSEELSSVILSSKKATISMLKQILSSKNNQDVIFQLFKDYYPELDERILIYKLVEKRKQALNEFKFSLPDKTKLERNYWQAFLEKNKWMFGLSYLLPLEEKRIDINNTVDYIFKADDGFVDIIEIKHPHHEFWKMEKNSYKRYRGFLQIGDELRGSITQATNYIFQLEKKFSDPDWQAKNKCNAPVKPKCTLVYGRSVGWEIEENTAFRLLNDSLHGVKVITFDHLYNRAERLLNILSEQNNYN